MSAGDLGSTYARLGSGLGNVGSYLVSTVPFASASLAIPATGSVPIVISFPSVTNWVTVKNTLDPAAAASPIKFGWSASGTDGDNFVPLDNGESYTGNWKIVRIYVVGQVATPSSASVVAGLTGISNDHLRANWSGSQGVG